MSQDWLSEFVTEDGFFFFFLEDDFLKDSESSVPNRLSAIWGG